MISTSISAIGLAPHLAGGTREVRTAGDANRTQGDGHLQSATATRFRQATREVGESEGEVADRDADGRLPWQAPSGSPEEQPEEKPAPHPEAERGGRLDCLA